MSIGDGLSSRPRKTPWTGRRKATSVYCTKCRRWHDTPLGRNPERCPLEDDLFDQVALAPVFIPKEKLGTMPAKRVSVPFKLEG